MIDNMFSLSFYFRAVLNSLARKIRLSFAATKCLQVFMETGYEKSNRIY